MANWVFERGLHEVGDGLYAYLQPTGAWGWSNAGLVASGQRSLLVDTLFDLPLTRDMLEAMKRATSAAESIDTVVNTHANGDHCWGNQLVAGADIIASSQCAAEMLELSPKLVAKLVKGSRIASRGGMAAKLVARGLGRLGLRKVGAIGDAADFVVDIFGEFDFSGIELTPPTTTFDGEKTVTVGDKEVRLIEVGPAHTRGDVIVYVPGDRVVFTGDILFANGHPIVWEGPVQNWIDACERIESFDVDVVVPGHGPITDTTAVARLAEYLRYICAEAKLRYEGGMSAFDAACDIDIGDYDGWGEWERLVINVETVYRELSGRGGERDPVEQFSTMAKFRKRMQ
jgi:glyoxylase-like metal-dependent hydrolase (beta-lactamase superfamily II)